MEDNDEKTVGRSPDPSGGNGGELDLLGRKTLSRDKYITFCYLVRGEGMGDIEAGVPETAQGWSDLEVLCVHHQEDHNHHNLLEYMARRELRQKWKR